MSRTVGSREDGFTLVELLVVLSIMGIMLGAALFGVKKMIPGAELKSETYEVISDFRRIQQRAISEQREYGIRFDTANDNYTIFNGSEDMETKNLANKGIDIEINFISDEVTFDPIGTSNLNGSVFLTNNNGEKYRIYVYRTTGRVRLEKVE